MITFFKKMRAGPRFSSKKRGKRSSRKMWQRSASNLYCETEKKIVKRKRKGLQMRFFRQRQCSKIGESLLQICTESREQQRMRMLLQNAALWNNREEKIVAGFVYNKLTRKKDVPTAALRSSRNSETFH